MQNSSNNIENSGDSNNSVLAAPSSAGRLFRRRIFAATIDGTVVGALSSIVVLVFLYYVVVILHNKVAAIEHGPIATYYAGAFCYGFVDVLTGFGILFWPISMIAMAFWLSSGWPLLLPRFELLMMMSAPVFINWLYHVISESSPKQATLGKAMMGLKVRSFRGDRPSVFRASVRHAAKSLMYVAAALPILYFLCNRRQFLYDRIAGTEVDFKSERKVISAIDQHPQEVSVELRERCAGIPRRIAASLVDCLLFYSCEFLISAAIVAIGFRFPLTASNLWQYWPVILTLECCGYFSGVVLPMVIFAAFESSPLGATPGKILMSAYVSDLSGNKLTFAQACEKQLVQAASYASLIPVITILSVVLAAIAKATNCWFLPLGAVVAFPAGYLVLICVTFWRGQSVVDRISKRLVLVEQPIVSPSVRLIS
jgi:uncharacterized RDD family membrane protein YckC